MSTDHRLIASEPPPRPAVPAHEISLHPAASIPATAPAPNGSPRWRSAACRFFYGKFQALNDINLDIHDRQITAFIGPSGCGKSTLLRTLNRIYELYPGQRATGRIMLGGRNLLDRADDVNLLRAKIGMVFQKPTPFPMSVQDNIALRRRAVREAVARRDGGARAMGAREGGALGRGQGQAAPGRHRAVRRAAAAPVHRARGGGEARGAVARRARLGAGSDLDAEDRAVDVRAASREYTIAIVTHNMQQAARVSDYTAFMYLGRIVEFGDTKTMFTKPTHQQTEEYITGRFG